MAVSPIDLQTAAKWMDAVPPADLQATNSSAPERVQRAIAVLATRTALGPLGAWLDESRIWSVLSQSGRSEEEFLVAVFALWDPASGQDGAREAVNQALHSFDSAGR